MPIMECSPSRFIQNLVFSNHLINGRTRHSLGDDANQFAKDTIGKDDLWAQVGVRELYCHGQIRIQANM